MRIRKIEVKGFRLLKDVSISLEEQTTVIVGRNNSGKTSLTEIFRRLLSDKAPTFLLEDFSLSLHQQFWNAFQLKKSGAEEVKVREALPTISVEITVSYSKDEPALGALSAFIIDLDPACTDARILVTYGLSAGAIDGLLGGIQFSAGATEDQQKKELSRTIRERIPKQFATSVLAIDPSDPTNRKELEWRNVRALVRGGFINAQRGLDDETLRHKNVLGAILESLFKTAGNDSADPADQSVVQRLEEAVKGIQKSIDEGFNGQLTALLPAFSLFGYPRFTDPRLLTETTLDVGRLLTDHTKINYAGVNGINLPETYNGLGARNLVFILLKLLQFFKAFATEAAAPGAHLVFIEEPEVHLHPQMQEVFIKQINAIAAVFKEKFPNSPLWPVQFVVTTHSSHVANRASFQLIRYFSAGQASPSDGFRTTMIRDLREGIGGTPQEDQDFLHKYLTLTRCDLFFADKAVLIEGATERLLMPRIIEKVDAAIPESLRLGSQYVTVMEVGGAYAHIFFNLLNFLDLRTLVITDLDTTDKNKGGEACRVSDGTNTSNQCIRKWFKDPEISPAVLLQKTALEKTVGNRRLAFQVSDVDSGACGRSFEDAFILANQSLFAITGSSVSDLEDSAWKLAEKISKKSTFALEYAVHRTSWRVPRYIDEALRWLAEDVAPQSAASQTAKVAPTENVKPDPQVQKDNG